MERPERRALYVFPTNNEMWLPSRPDLILLCETYCFIMPPSPGPSRRATLFVYKNCTGWHILGLGGRGTHLNSIAIVRAKLANMTNKAAAEAGEVFLVAAPGAVIYLNNACCHLLTALPL